MARSHDTRPGTATNLHNPTLQVRRIVLDAVNEYLPEIDRIGIDEVYVVPFTYILDNWKAIVSTTIPDDRIYEVTHRASGETYCDVYYKERQKVIHADDPVHNL